jgi:putative dimethyl sulfoxide reductase chaperone
MKKLNTLPHEQQTALLEGIEALCRIFWGPDEASCEAMLAGELWRPFAVLATAMGTTTTQTLDRIRFETARFASAKKLHEHLEEIYVRLFIGSRLGITAPLYQSCYAYENAPLMGPPAEEMAARFMSKGLAISENRHEPPDHLSLQLEYLYFLLNGGWDLTDDDLTAEAASFAATMTPWVIRLREKLERDTGDRFYWMAAMLLVSCLQFIGWEENGIHAFQ